MTCYHCESDHDFRENVPCPYGQGLPHCRDHCAQCARCGELGCIEALVKTESGEWLCSVCYEIEKDPVIIAARRAAVTGSHRDVHEYLKLRKAVN